MNSRISATALSDHMWRPPKGYQIVATDVDKGKGAMLFESETIEADPDLELWLFRMPKSVAVKDIAAIEIPATALHEFGLISGTHSSPRVDAFAEVNRDGTISVANAPELQDVTCLLSHRKDNVLSAAPRSVSRHFTITNHPTSPAVDLSSHSIIKIDTSIQQPSGFHAFTPIGALGMGVSDRIPIILADASDLDIGLVSEDQKVPSNDRVPLRNKIKRHAEARTHRSTV